MILSLLLPGCAAFTNGKRKNYDKRPIVCLGDSLTAGYGASTPGTDDISRSYPAYLQKKTKISVINAGVSGNTTGQGLYRVDTDVLLKDPQIVIILLGANDYFQGLSISSIQDNLQKIINKVNSGNRKIYLAKFYSGAMVKSFLTLSGITDTAQQANLINQFDTMFSTLASINNVELIDDIWTGVWGIHMSDNHHPNAIGYEIMANNIFKCLRPYLKNNGS